MDTSSKDSDSSASNSFQVEHLAAWVQYVEKCSLECSGCCPSETDTNSKAQAVLRSVLEMLERMQKVCSSRALLALADGSLQKKPLDIAKLVPSQYRPVANALQTDFAKEADALKEDIGLQGLAERLSLMESALSCCQSELLQNEAAFSQKRAECQEYGNKFSAALEKTLDSEKITCLDPTKQFVGKYGDVTSCVEAWKMKEVEWVFSKDNEKDINSDIDSLKQARKSGQEMLKSLASIVSFKAQSKLLQDALKLCHQTKEEMEGQLAESAKLAAVMVFADMILSGSGNASTVEKNEKYLRKTFGVGKDSLPDKLKELVKESEKKTGPPSTKEEKGGKGQSQSSAATKKEKKEKKEKQEKDNKSDKNKRRQSDPADQHAKKAKKSK